MEAPGRGLFSPSICRHIFRNPHSAMFCQLLPATPHPPLKFFPNRPNHGTVNAIVTLMRVSQNDLLRATSRSFYLTLRVLPRAIRPQIGLAYLLARTADTIADTEIVPLAQRLEALQKLRERILDKNAGSLNFGGL